MKKSQLFEIIDELLDEKSNGEEVDSLIKVLHEMDPTYRNLAVAVAKLLKGDYESPDGGDTGYGSHSYQDFISVLRTELEK
jgi:hypothetical protein